GPEREVAEDIEDRKSVCELLQEIKHGTWSVPSSALSKSAANENYNTPNLSRMRATSLPSPTPFDPLSITESPAASASITSPAISSAVCVRVATSPAGKAASSAAMSAPTRNTMSGCAANTAGANCP